MRITNPTAVLGEDLATSYLKKNKYKILERNVKLGHGEIDIVAIDFSENEPVLSFIEVKTRTSNMFGTPLEAISYFKLRTLIHTAQLYKSRSRGLPQSLRIDAVSVILDNNHEVASIELHKNISV